MANVFGVGPGSLNEKVLGKVWEQRAERLERGGRAGSESGQLGIEKNAVEEEVEPPKMIRREKEKRLQRLEEASANLREPMDGKLFCFLTKSQKSLAKLELSNREELKIG